MFLLCIAQDYPALSASMVQYSILLSIVKAGRGMGGKAHGYQSPKWSNAEIK
jgi:hypothetical protein